MNAIHNATPVDSTAPAAPVHPVMPAPRLAFTLRETAVLLGISERSVRRLISRGLLRPCRALRRLLIPRQEIERFLNMSVGKERPVP